MRLVSMGVEPFMAASALTLVAAQRLVRRNCRQCLEEYRPAPEVLMALGGAICRRWRPGAKFLRGRDCAACKGRGYQGRVAILELMMVSPDCGSWWRRTGRRASCGALAMREGMRTLRQSGLAKAIDGVTTVEEVLRVCLSDE